MSDKTPEWDQQVGKAPYIDIVREDARWIRETGASKGQAKKNSAIFVGDEMELWPGYGRKLGNML